MMRKLAPSNQGVIQVKILAIAAVFVLGGIGYGLTQLGPSGTSTEFIYHTTKLTDLDVTVTERGNLESQEVITVFNEVDDIEGDSIHGAVLVEMVPNGSSVKEGDIIARMDSASLIERMDRQTLETDKIRSYQIQAQVKFDNQKTQNETNLAEAHLAVELAELAQKQFEDEDGGTFQIDLQDIELTIQTAQASKLIQQTNLEGVKKLYDLGYRSQGELAQAQLSAMKAERELASAIAKKKELVEYQYKKTRMTLAGSVASAKRSLRQVERDNEALMAQAQATLDEANKALKKEEERFTRYETQLTKCEIKAPASGMLAYSVPKSRYYSEIREGAQIRPKQAMFTIPNLKKMQVKTSVHESVLGQVQPGLPATIRVDVKSGTAYAGSVLSVAVLPEQDRYRSSDTKVYETVVTIDEEVDAIKPGMTAVVEIHVASLSNVITVPVTSIIQIGNQSWCFIKDGSGHKEVQIELGMTNERFVEVKSGLKPDQEVVINPDSLIDDESRKAKEKAAEEEEKKNRPKPKPGAKKDNKSTLSNKKPTREDFKNLSDEEKKKKIAEYMRKRAEAGGGGKGKGESRGGNRERRGGSRGEGGRSPRDR